MAACPKSSNGRITRGSSACNITRNSNPNPSRRTRFSRISCARRWKPRGWSDASAARLLVFQDIAIHPQPDQRGQKRAPQARARVPPRGLFRGRTQFIVQHRLENPLVENPAPAPPFPPVNRLILQPPPQGPVAGRFAAWLCQIEPAVDP